MSIISDPQTNNPLILDVSAHFMHDNFKNHKSGIIKMRMLEAS